MNFFLDITKELLDLQVVILVIPSKSYMENTVEVTKQLAEKGNVCYVTFNKTVDSLCEIFEKKGIKKDKFLFIDTISASLKQTPKQDEKCYYINSPESIPELSDAISRALKHGFDYLVFDSLTNLFIYQEEKQIINFVSNIVSKIRETNIRTVFFALDIPEKESLLKECQMFVDYSIEFD